MDAERISDAELNARFTKAYEAQHARKVVDVYTPSLRQRWDTAPFTHKLAAILIVGFFLPWAIIIGGLVCLVIWDKITR